MPTSPKQPNRTSALPGPLSLERARTDEHKKSTELGLPFLMRSVISERRRPKAILISGSLALLFALTRFSSAARCREFILLSAKKSQARLGTRRHLLNSIRYR